MRKLLIVVAISGLLALTVPSHAATQTVRAVGFNFIAPVVLSGTTDTIRLENLDQAIIPGHSFTTDAIICLDSLGTKIKCDTGVIPQRGAGSVNLSAAAGTYDFYCTLHRSLGMVGKLVVR